MTEKTVTSYKVTANEVKKQLNIDEAYVADDSYIIGLIEAASDLIKGMIAADVELTDNVLTLKDKSGTFKVYDVPLVEMTSVKLNGETREDYTIEKHWSYFYVTLPDGTFDTVELTFKTGHTSLPPALKQAIIIKAATMYDQERGNMIVGTITSKIGVVESLIGDYKRKYW